MITDDMTRFLNAAGKAADPDSLDAAFADWTNLGRYTGFRRSEWCQKTQTVFQKIEDWEGQPAQAMILEDFEFYGPGGRRIYDMSRVTWKDIDMIKIRWRKQKNGNNGQTITYKRDYKNPDFCPVRAAYNIYLRAIRLNVPKGEPIAVFKGKDGKRLFITEQMVTDKLREAAHKVLGLKKDDPEIMKWSSHSIRVTACNLLHRKRFSDSFIKNRLRWESDAFLVYLRNTIYAAEDHTKALELSSNNLPVGASYRRESSPEDILWVARAA